LCFLFCVVFERGPHYVAQAGFKLTIFLPLHSQVLELQGVHYHYQLLFQLLLGWDDFKDGLSLDCRPEFHRWTLYLTRVVTVWRLHSEGTVWTKPLEMKCAQINPRVWCLPGSLLSCFQELLHFCSAPWLLVKPRPQKGNWIA
jgi:hypothetical protein